MEKEKVVFFLDYANIHRAAKEKRYRLDYQDLLHYVGEERFLVEAYCYVPINPRNEHRLDGEIEGLWRSGYIVHTKKGSIAGGTYKCNFDVEIAMDVLKVMYQVKPDIIVLASGDSDFVPLIQEVRKSGIRVEVAAFVGTAGPDILLKCSGFVDLAVYYESYLATQHGEQGEERIIEEQFKDLIQAQRDDQDEEDKGEEEDEEEDEAMEMTKMTAEQVGEEITVPTSELLDLEFGVNVNVINGMESRVPASDDIDVDDLSL